MLIPLVVPLLYVLFYKRNNARSIVELVLVIVIIVFLYDALIAFSWFGSFSYVLWKTVLFIGFPLLVLFFSEKKNVYLLLSSLGLKRIGLEKSIMLALSLIPVMLVVTGIVLWLQQSTFLSSEVFAIISFFESFTEEFFFRGVLFLFLMKKTNTNIALFTSIACFILAHPQHFNSFFLVSTIVQAVLTVIIVYRSKNLIGAWLLHGTNRVSSLLLFPFVLSLFITS